jgi:cytochrome c-type biogenesis protein CcmH
MKYVMRSLQALVLLIALWTSAPSWAVQPDEVLSDPGLEARARAISKELRCMVCQNESIDDSEAPLAHDLRVLVRERLKAGDGDQQIINFLVSRYGEFVLLRPPLSWHTAALWGTPPALVLLGIIMIVVVERRRRTTRAQKAPLSLTAAEEARLADILRGDAGTPS